MVKGLSVYLNYELSDIEKVLKKAFKHNFSYVFSSLHIPEDDISECKGKFLRILEICTEYKLNLIVDVSPRTLKLFDISSFDELSEMGLKYLRTDFGFDVNQLFELSKNFNLVINASTFTDELFNQLDKLHFDFDRIIACHNFYPKKYTGLSEEKTLTINRYLHSKGIKVIGFVDGDVNHRGPLYEGLPTVECLRNEDVFFSSLVMNKKLDCDIVIISEFDVSDKTLKQYDDLEKGYIEIECCLKEGYDEYLSYVHHDRVDNSEYFIRSHESIYKHYINRKIIAENCIERHKGDICVSNEKYLRYNGELEIMLKDLPGDNRVNVIGHSDSKLIDFIDYNTGILLKKVC